MAISLTIMYVLKGHGMKNFFSALCGLVFAFALTACGGGGSDIPPVEELRAVYNTAPEFFDEVSNPDTTMVGSSVGEDTRLIISYKNNLIYDKTYWSMSAGQGFTRDGTYLIVVEGASPDYARRDVDIFVNGQAISIPIEIQSGRVLRDIREFGDGWIILRFVREGDESEPLQYPSFLTLYNVRTGEFIDYGEVIL